MIEEVHWGLTPAEQMRVLWDISWIWGPPEDHLAKLFLEPLDHGGSYMGHSGLCGSRRTPRANLDLLPDDLANAQLGDPEKFGA